MPYICAIIGKAPDREKYFLIMERYLKKQTSTDNTDSNSTKKGMVDTKKYLSSVKEYKPEYIKGYTPAF
ncbi:hypothetical protein GCM10009122_44840 [Fulvivirga kasyanovii]